MSRRISNLLRFVAILGLTFVFAACSSKGPEKKGGHRDDGRIFLKNETNAIVDVSYVNEELGQIDTVVNPGETKDISQALLKGGTEVTVRVQARTNMAAIANIPITIDGNRTIRITALGVWGTGTLQYVVQ